MVFKPCFTFQYFIFFFCNSICSWNGILYLYYSLPDSSFWKRSICSRYFSVISSALKIYKVNICIYYINKLIEVRIKYVLSIFFSFEYQNPDTIFQNEIIIGRIPADHRNLTRKTHFPMYSINIEFIIKSWTLWFMCMSQSFDTFNIMRNYSCF